MIKEWSSQLSFLTVLAFVALWAPFVLAEPIKIGVSLPLKGEAATYGTDILNSLKFANEELFKNRYRLIVEEDGCSGGQAVTVAQKLVNIDQVKYVLGFGCSSAVLSSAPIYEKAKVVIISSSATAPGISKAGEYIFRTYPSSVSGTDALSKYIIPRHRRLGIVSEETDYAQGVLSGLKDALKNSTVEIVTENYLPGTTDFRNTLNRLKSRQVDGLMFNPQAEDKLILLMKQLLESGWRVPIYGFIYPSSATFLKALGTRADGIIFADAPSFSDLSNEESEQLYKKFVAAYGSPISMDVIFSTAVLSFQALDQAIQSGQEVQPFLATHTFKTIHGDFSFDRNGDPIGLSYVLKTLKDGKPILLK